MNVELDEGDSLVVRFTKVKGQLVQEILAINGVPGEDIDPDDPDLARWVSATDPRRRLRSV